jgi:hypothetical protein
MAADATTGYISARSEGKDAAILCDRWEITDAINNKLHHHYRGDGDATTVTAARDHQIAAGDIILSRHNDASITVAPGPDHKRGDRIDQVRNGIRWRVAWVDADAGQIAAERLTDNARAIFEGDYRREHITLGYATTVHAAQGMPVGNDRTRGVCWALLSDRASRSMAYVGMTRARDENHLGIYPAVLNEVDTEQTSQMRRGTKHQAAAVLHTIATANDDRPRTMTAEAAHADRALLPTAIAALLDDHDERRASRAHAWQRHITRENAREAAYQRFAETNQQAAQRRRSKDRDRGYGLEL